MELVWYFWPGTIGPCLLQTQGGVSRRSLAAVVLVQGSRRVTVEGENGHILDNFHSVLLFYLSPVLYYEVDDMDMNSRELLPFELVRRFSIDRIFVFVLRDLI